MFVSVVLKGFSKDGILISPLYGLGERGEVLHRNRGEQPDERTKKWSTLFSLTWDLVFILLVMKM